MACPFFGQIKSEATVELSRVDKPFVERKMGPRRVGHRKTFGTHKDAYGIVDD